MNPKSCFAILAAIVFFLCGCATYRPSGESAKKQLIYDIGASPIPENFMLRPIGYSAIEAHLSTENETAPAITPQMGHTSTTTSVDFSPDGKYFISGSCDRTVKLWDVASGKELRTYSGHSAPVWSVDYSPDGRFFVSGSTDATVKLWDIESGKELHTFTGHKAEVMAVAFSPDGRRIASGSADNSIKIWNVETGTELYELTGHSKTVWDLCFFPNSRYLISGSEDGTLKTWDLRTGELLETRSFAMESIKSVDISIDSEYLLFGSFDLFDHDAGIFRTMEVNGPESRNYPGPAGGITAIRFSSDRKYVFSGSNNGTITKWNTETGLALHTYKGHTSGITSISLSPDNKYLISTSFDGTVKLWDATIAAEPRTIDNTSDVSSVAFSPDGRYIASAGKYNGTIRVWDSAGLAANAINTGNFGINTLDFSPDGKAIASGGDDTLDLWETESGKKLRTFAERSRIVSVRFSPDGRYLASTSEGRGVKLWDAASGKLLRTYEGSANINNSVDFSSDGKYIAVCGFRDIQIIEALTGKTAYTLADCHGVPLVSACYSPDGKYLASASYEQIKLWNTSNWEEVFTIKGQKGVDLVIFSPNGGYLVSGSNEGTITLWDAASGAELRSYRGHSGPVRSVSFSSDGNHVVSGSEDGFLKIWDTMSGISLRTYTGSTSHINSAAFSPDGKSIIAGSTNGGIHVFDAYNGRLIQNFSGYESYKTRYSPDGKYIVFLNSCDGKLLDAYSGKELFTNKSGLFSDGNISNDSSLLILGDFSGEITLVDITTGKIVRSLHPTDGMISSVVFSPDDKYIVAESLNKNGIYVWEIADDREVPKFKETDRSIICFYPGSNYVLSNFSDSTSKLWDIEDGKILRTILTQPLYSRKVAFSPDGNYIASESDDGSIIIWDAASGTKLRTLTGHTNFIKSVAFSPDGKSILSSSGDDTICIWNWESNTWTAIVAGASGGKWLVFNRDGYWDGSADCGDLVAMVRGIEAWNIDQFAVRNNRPDIVALGLGAEPAVVEGLKAAWMTRLRRLGITEANTAGGYRIPTSAIASAEQTGKYIDLDLVFKSEDKDLLRYQVFVNDVPLFGAIGKSLSGIEAKRTESIELTRGENKIEASCIDAGGAESFRATRTAAWHGETKPDLYFLAFGVSEYADPAIPDLKYAAKDALDLEEYFKGMDGSSFGNVFTRVYADAQVTKSAIAQAKAFTANAKPDDTFVLFISGHGIQLSNPARKSADDGETRYIPTSNADASVYYYITSDAKLNDLAGTAADFDTVEDLLQGIPPRDKLFLMDSCQSGEADETATDLARRDGSKGLYARSLSKEQQRGLAVTPKALSFAAQRDRWIHNDLVRRSGAIVISSCEGDQASMEADVWQQGAFTKGILSALGDPDADLDADGAIDTNELRLYVAGYVPRIVRSLDPAAQQNPTVDRDNIYKRLRFPLMNK